MNYSDLSINDYEFEDNKLLRIGYRSLYDGEIKEKKKKIYSNIKWRFSTEGGQIKCRRDDKYKANIIVQNSFDIDYHDFLFF